ncbi:hypothetical protein [Bradyrhizobium diazoefficiens]
MTTLRDQALDCLLDCRWADVAVARDWPLLREIAALAQADAPTDLLPGQPDLFRRWREAVTKFHLSGWSYMTPERVVAVAGDRFFDMRPPE